MDYFKECAKREYSAKQRFIAIAFAGLIFALLIPFGIALGAGTMDRALNLPRLYWGVPNIIAGVVLIAIGWPLALWSIYVQFKLASGTPLPMMPTHKLIITGPFVYCRNPMTLGALLAYFGIAVILGSISALAIVLVLTILLLLYIKLIEEKELAARFGDEYLEYRKSTPLILPRLKRNPD